DEQARNLSFQFAPLRLVLDKRIIYSQDPIALHFSDSAANLEMRDEPFKFSAGELAIQFGEDFEFSIDSGQEGTRINAMLSRFGSEFYSNRDCGHSPSRTSSAWLDAISKE